MRRVLASKRRGKITFGVAVLVESLECRRLLSVDTITWVGTAGNWNVAANWDANRVPKEKDNVVLPAGADVTVSENEEAALVTIAPGATLDVTGGTVSKPIGLDASDGLSSNGTIEIGPTSILGISAVTNPYSYKIEGTIILELGGPPASGKFGQIDSETPFNIFGTLQTVVVNGYTPAAGDAFDVLSYQSLNGNFSSFSTIGGGDIAFTPALSTTGGVLIGTVDATPPISTVSRLPVGEVTTTFPVAWSGGDFIDGSGIKSYNVFVSDNGGSFTPFQTNTTQTSADFAGQVGHTYGFYSVATDNAGNVQATPTAAQTTTDVDGTVTTTSTGGKLRTIIRGTDGNDTIRIGKSSGVVSISVDGTNNTVKASAAGAIQIRDGAGQDSITLAPSSPAVNVNGGSGADTIIAKNYHAETLKGGAAGDSIVGGLGVELIEGGEGSNTLIAGSGNETLVGGPGGDSIVGGPGADSLLGGGGLDTISAGSEDSTIDGNGGL